MPDIIKYSTVPTRLLNTPLMVNKSVTEQMKSVLTGSWIEVQKRPEEQGPPEGVAVIPIFDELMHRGYWWYGTSYPHIQRTLIQALEDPSVKAILLNVDSPGGEVGGCFDLAKFIYKARKIKPIVAIANEMAYSAAYALFSGASKRYMTATGGVGSIGVRYLHVDYSEYNKKRGVTYTDIVSGTKKAEFSSDSPLSESAFNTLQDRCNYVAQIFFETVNLTTKIPIDTIKSWEAGMFWGQDAIKNKLADKIMSYDEAFERAASLGKKNTTISQSNSLNPGGNSMNELKTQLQTGLGDPSQTPAIETMLGELGFIRKPSEDSQALITRAKEDGNKQGRQDGLKQAEEILGLCETYKVMNLANSFIKENKSTDQVKDAIMTELAKGNTNQITGQVNPLGFGQTSSGDTQTSEQVQNHSLVQRAKALKEAAEKARRRD